MIKGGYKIVDFNGVTLSGTAVEMPGIYDQIVDDYDKAILVSGVSLNGELQDDSFAAVKVNDGSVNLTVYGGVITVTEDDDVTFAAAKSNAELTGDVESLMIKSPVHIRTNDDLDTVYNALTSNLCVPVAISASVMNSGFGVNNSANGTLLKSSSRLLFFVATSGQDAYICRGGYDPVSHTWTIRHRDQMTAYTPA